MNEPDLKWIPRHAKGSLTQLFDKLGCQTALPKASGNPASFTEEATAAFLRRLFAGSELYMQLRALYADSAEGSI